MFGVEYVAFVVQRSGFRIQGLGCGFQVSGFVQGSGFRVQGLGYGFWDSRFRFQGSGVGFEGSGCTQRAKNATIQGNAVAR